MNSTMEVYIEHIKLDDEAALKAVSAIEDNCFPASERESIDTLRERAINALDFFWLLRLREDGRIIGFINGFPTKQEKYTDAVFTDISLCDHAGEYVMLISLDIAPEYQNQGMARYLLSSILEELKAKGCYKEALGISKASLVKYYETFGFRDLGISECHYGGKEWHDLAIKLK